MALTFTALCGYADFETAPADREPDKGSEGAEDVGLPPSPEERGKQFSLGGLVYNIQLILPESRDPKVYDALFEALRRHLS